MIFDKNFILKKELSRLETINPIKISKEDNHLNIIMYQFLRNDNKWVINASIFNTNTKEIVKIPINLINGLSFSPNKIINKKMILKY